MPTVAGLMDSAGLGSTLGALGSTGLSTLVGMANPIAGMAMTGYNGLAHTYNTVQNAGMLSDMGDPLGFGQMLGGALGLNGYGGTAAGAMNAAMATPQGRLALSPSQTDGTMPDVSMPTQLAPTVAVTSAPLGGTSGPAGLTSGPGTQGGAGFSPGAASGEDSAGAAAAGDGGDGGDGGGGYARGGKVKPKRGGTNVIIVMPHPIMGALAIAALHHHMMQRRGPVRGALQQAGAR